MSLSPDALALTLSRHVDLSNDRCQTLAMLITGVLNARTVNLSHIASQVGGTALVASSYRRLQRFFQYVRLDEDWLARALVAMLGLAWTGPTGRSEPRISTFWCCASRRGACGCRSCGA